MNSLENYESFEQDFLLTETRIMNQPLNIDMQQFINRQQLKPEIQNIR